MKKLYTTLVTVLAIAHFSYAQWTGGPTGNVYYNGGNVGIGTAAPNYPLTLNSAAETGILTINNGTSLYLSHGGWSMGAGKFGIGNGVVPTLVVNTVANGESAIGNVGIGTTSPISQLEVKGPNYFDASTVVHITNNSSDFGRTNLIITGRIQQNNDAWTFGSGARNSIVFAENASASSTNIGAVGDEKYSLQLEGNSSSLGFLSKQNGAIPNMVMVQNGNVGIGTTQPDQKLTVNGTIHSKEVKVDTSIPVPDYVFEPTYKLPQLSELKTYLDANHHLPEIPSAKEMEKNGINLSEMNLKLLKKVEELTLYLIDKDKEIKDLKTSQQEQIDALKSQMQSLQKNLNR